MRTITASLEQQVVAAITADRAPPLDQLLTLCSALEAAITAADDEAQTASCSLLDPIAEPDIRKAQAAVEATKYTADRLRTILPRLQSRARAVELEDDRREWALDFAAAIEVRNALAKELRETYPAAVAALVNLFGRVAANDAALSQLHQSRPDGAKGYLLGAELTARGLEAHTRDQPSLVRELRLPDWSNSARLAFPAPQPSAGFVLSEPPPYDARYSSDWATAKRAEITARRADECRKIEAERAATAENKRAYERSLVAR